MGAHGARSLPAHGARSLPSFRSPPLTSPRSVYHYNGPDGELRASAHVYDAPGSCGLIHIGSVQSPFGGGAFSIEFDGGVAGTPDPALFVPPSYCKSA